MKTSIFTIIACVSFLFSCKENFLDQLPLDSPSNANFFSNESELNLAINGAYTDLWWLGQSKVPYYMYLDAMTDIAWSRGDYGQAQTVQSGNFSTEDNIFNDTWNHMYGGISKCNNILENMNRAVGNVSEESFNMIKAQALFLRSFYYFYLIEFYGDVPWVDRMLTLDSSNLERMPKDQVVTNLYNDLDFASSILPERWNGKDEGRATEGAALTLKARLALNEGDFETAREASKKVIDLGVYSIYPNYEDLFHYIGEDNEETIFKLSFLTGVQTTGIPQIEGSRHAPGYSILIPTQRLVDIYQCTDGLNIDKSPLYNPAKPFNNRDPRLDQSIIRPGTWFDGYLFETDPRKTTTQVVNGGDTVDIENIEVTNAFATFSGYLWLKYMDGNDLPTNVTNSQLNFILMRYAEVLLTYAEAKIELNDLDQSVIDAINLVRGRESVQMPLVDFSMNQETLRQIVRYERTVEFADEGFRLFDIRRWKYAEHVIPGKVYGRRNTEHWDDEVIPSIDEWGRASYANADAIFNIISTNSFDPGKNYLWPIPQRQRDVESGLSQNDGY